MAPGLLPAGGAHGRAGLNTQLRRPRSTTWANFGARPRLHLKAPPFGGGGVRTARSRKGSYKVGLSPHHASGFLRFFFSAGAGQGEFGGSLLWCLVPGKARAAAGPRQPQAERCRQLPPCPAARTLGTLLPGGLKLTYRHLHIFMNLSALWGVSYVLCKPAALQCCARKLSVYSKLSCLCFPSLGSTKPVNQGSPLHLVTVVDVRVL